MPELPRLKRPPPVETTTDRPSLEEELLHWLEVLEPVDGVRCELRPALAPEEPEAPLTVRSDDISDDDRVEPIDPVDPVDPVEATPLERSLGLLPEPDVPGLLERVAAVSLDIEPDAVLERSCEGALIPADAPEELVEPATERIEESSCSFSAIDSCEALLDGRIMSSMLPTFSPSVPYTSLPRSSFAVRACLSSDSSMRMAVPELIDALPERPVDEVLDMLERPD